MRCDPARRQAPPGLQVLCLGLQAGDAHRFLHGLVGRRLRGAMDIGVSNKLRSDEPRYRQILSSQTRSQRRAATLSFGEFHPRGRLPLADLARIAQSLGAASRSEGVPVITGDAKVVERGKADGVFISTAAVGVVPEGLELSGDKARPGDCVIVSGSIGDQNLAFDCEILSDFGAVARSRRRLAAAACELLGLDPLNVANEGKLVAVTAPEGRKRCFQPCAPRSSAVTPRSSASPSPMIPLRADDLSFGGARIVDWLAGEQLPRIC